MLNYLVRNGSERVVSSSREHIYDLRSLENYTYVDEFGKDQGINVRHKVRELIDFIQDDDKLRDERKKAKKNKDKYVGMSNEAMGMNFGSGGGGDKWSDNPKWTTPTTKPQIESYNDWDKDCRNKNIGNNYDDPNNSDDGEREDSDNDNNHSPRKNNDNNKDIRQTIDTFDKVKKIINTQQQLRTTQVNRNIKKVDLGAAANYGKEQTINTSTPSSLISSPIKKNNKNNDDILNDLFDSKNDNNTRSIIDNDDDDDFNPRDNDYNTQVSKNINANFGDFTSAFSGVTSCNTKQDNNDEFADFTSAFNSSLTIGNDNWGSTPIQNQSLINSSDGKIGGGNFILFILFCYWKIVF